MAQLLGEPSFAADGCAEASLWSPLCDVPELRERLRSLHPLVAIEEMPSDETPQSEAVEEVSEVEGRERIEVEPEAPGPEARRGVRGRLSRPPKA